MSSDKNNISRELIRKFLAGECTDEERDSILSYISKHVEDEEVQQWMHQAWQNVLTNPPAENREEAKLRFSRLEKRIVFRKKRSSWSAFYKFAAFILVLVSASVYSIAYWYDILDYIDPVAMVEQRTQAGERLLTELPDGSKVWLNASSRLVFPAKFRRNTRQISLEGEAFFEVVKNKKKPFIVETGAIRTRVLGTSFNIKAYQEDPDIQVTVRTGVVSVNRVDSLSSTLASLDTLLANQQLWYNKLNAGITKEISMTTETSSCWREGKLVFKKTKFKDVATILERWFRVDFVIADTTANDFVFTASFKEGTSLEDVLKTLSMTNKIRYARRGSVIKIYPHGNEHKNKKAGI